jgi:hypothetical protein
MGAAPQFGYLQEEEPHNALLVFRAQFLKETTEFLDLCESDTRVVTGRRSRAVHCTVYTHCSVHRAVCAMQGGYMAHVAVAVREHFGPSVEPVGVQQSPFHTYGHDYV